MCEGQLILYKGRDEIDDAISLVCSQLVANQHVDGYGALVLMQGGDRFFCEVEALLREKYGKSFSNVYKIPLCSYQGLNSSGQVEGLELLDQLDGTDRMVVFDDILDTGLTLESVSGYLKRNKEKTVKTCVLFVKDLPDAPQRVRCDYSGLHIKDEFVVGFGLDYQGKYRELEGLYIYQPLNDGLGLS